MNSGAGWRPGGQGGSSPNLGTNTGQPSTPSRVFSVSVVGLSGTEGEKGAAGTGKSCLCNRFIRPLEDDYFTDHISTLSQVDFGGSPVINNDHWLFWGERTVLIGSGDPSHPGTADSGQKLEWGFRLIEQTEFVDDESFQPLRGTGPHQKDPYLKRSVATKFQSPDKLMYICKDQLGLEAEYPQMLLQPEGKFSPDGFVCVFDTSSVPKRSFQAQSDFALQLLHQICKAVKKPVVLVATKCDEATPEGLKEAERLLARKELKSFGIPLVESSAHQNVNVEAAFVLLGHLIERSSRSVKPRVTPFRDAIRARQEVLEVARTAYGKKLRQAVKDYRVTWQQLTREMGQDPDFVHFVELFGRASAQKLFRAHQRELREHFLQQKLKSQSSRLPEVLQALIPEAEMVRGRSWEEVLPWIQAHPDFPLYFQQMGTLADSLEQAQEINDPRIPEELLHSPEADMIFRNFVNSLEAEFQQTRLQEDFEVLLGSCSQVTPGKPFSDVKIFLLGKESFENLSDSTMHEIYDKFQTLIRKARQDFVELLLENVEEFTGRLLFRRGKPSGNNLPGLSEIDMAEIQDRLQEDIRYRQLNRLFQARDNMICQYASFVTYPLRQHCLAGGRCVDSLVEQILASKLQRLDTYPPGLGGDTRGLNPEDINFLQSLPRRLNMVLLGPSYISNNLVSELKAHFPNDIYQIDISSGKALAPTRGQNGHSSFSSGDGSDVPGQPVSFSLAYRCVDGDLRFPSNAVNTPAFPADALVAIFSSRDSLEYIRDSLAHALLISATNAAPGKVSGFGEEERSDPVPVGFLNGQLPILLLLACDPTHLDDLPWLQQRGAELAQNLRCPFVGVGGMREGERSPRRSDLASGPSFFTREQIARLMSGIVNNSLEYKSGAEEPSISRLGALSSSPVIGRSLDIVPDSSAPDLRISLCLMCGDEFSPHALLTPFLNSQIPSRNSSLSKSGDPRPRSDSKFSLTALNHGLAAQSAPASLTIETPVLPSCGKKIRVEIHITAYHSAFLSLSARQHEHSQSSASRRKDGPQYHGYILAYCVKRVASLSHLKSFAQRVGPTSPLLIVAVGEVSEFFSDRATNALITEGNDIADKLRARFVTLSPATEQQVGNYTSFFDDVFNNRREGSRNAPEISTPPTRNGLKTTSNGSGKERIESQTSIPRFHEGMTENQEGMVESDYAPLSEFRSGHWGRDGTETGGSGKESQSSGSGDVLSTSSNPAPLSRYGNNHAPAQQNFHTHRVSGEKGSTWTPREGEELSYSLCGTAGARRSLVGFTEPPVQNPEKPKRSSIGGRLGSAISTASLTATVNQAVERLRRNRESYRRATTTDSSYSSLQSPPSEWNAQGSGPTGSAGQSPRFWRKFNSTHNKTSTPNVEDFRNSRDPHGALSGQRAGSLGKVLDETSPAPLATPEDSLEIGVEALTVKEPNARALLFSSEDENTYATLDSFNPSGYLSKSPHTRKMTDSAILASSSSRDPQWSSSGGGTGWPRAGSSSTPDQLSSSERDSSLEKVDRAPSPYEKVGRKPTPHKRARGKSKPAVPGGSQDRDGNHLQVGPGIAERLAQLNQGHMINSASGPTTQPHSNHSQANPPSAFRPVHRRAGRAEGIPDAFQQVHIHPQSTSQQLPRFPVSEEDVHFNFGPRNTRPVNMNGIYNREQHEYLYRNSHLLRMRSASEESLLDPRGQLRKHNHFQLIDSTESPPRTEAKSRRRRRSKQRNGIERSCSRSAGLGDGILDEEEEEIVGAAGKSFVRKVASSFRFRRKKGSNPNSLSIASPDPSMDFEGEQSSLPSSPLYSGRTPLSPLLNRKGGVLVLPPLIGHHSRSNGPDPASLGYGQPSGSGGDRLKPPGGVSGSVYVPQKSPRKETKSGRMDAAIRKISTVSGSSDSRKKSSNAMGVGSLLVPEGATLKSLQTSDTDPIPVFVRKCVEFIEGEGGLCLEGLYRVPGNQAQVNALELKFSEQGAALDIVVMDLPINAVATSLKNFFSALPEALIPPSIFDNVVLALSTGRDEQSKVAQLRHVLRRLPPENRALLVYFTSHLRKVANHAHVNSMDLRNLAKCFWPTLLRPHFKSFEMMTQLNPRLEEFTLLLFSNADFILQTPSNSSPLPPSSASGNPL